LYSIYKGTRGEERKKKKRGKLPRGDRGGGRGEGDATLRYWCAVFLAGGSGEKEEENDTAIYTAWG